MASINKLSIRGVRSFSPESQEQVISFYFPLTIIVGSNGCGKTTIIESLKYAITGSLPPGNKSGQSFIHDPKAVGQATVKGQIKLRFSNSGGKSMVVVRSMEVTQKKTTMSFKALDGILRATDPNTGQRVSLSHKCSELDRQIPALIGVSKAVMEHVVFCHQEESSWPLMEGSILKKRFDDIFDSARYAKALDSIRKLKLEYSNKGKDLKADLNGLASHKHAASVTRSEMEAAQEQIANLEESIAEYKERIQQNGELINEMNALTANYQNAKKNLMKHKETIQRKKAIAESIEEFMDHDFVKEGKTREDIMEMQNDFDSNAKDIENTLNGKSNDADKIKRIISELKFKLSSAVSVKTKLELEKEDYHNILKSKMKFLNYLSQKYDIPLPQSSLTQNSHVTIPATATQDSTVSSLTMNTAVDTFNHQSYTLSENQMSSFTGLLEQKKVDIEQELKDFKHSSQVEEDKLQAALSEAQGKHQAKESDKQRIQSEREKIAREIRQLTSSFSSTSKVRKNDVSDAERQVEDARKTLESLNGSPRKSLIPQEIKKCEDELSTKQRTIDDDNLILMDLRKFSKDQNEIQIMKDQVSSDINRLSDACEDQRFVLMKYSWPLDFSKENPNLLAFGELTEQVREKYEQTKHDLMLQESKIRDKTNETTEKQTLLTHDKRSMTNVENRLNVLCGENGGVKRIEKVIADVTRLEIQLYGTSGVSKNIEPRALLDHLEKRIAEFNSAGDNLESIERALKILRLMCLVNQDEGILECPCCSRQMDNDVVKKYQENFTILPQKIMEKVKNQSEQDLANMKQFEVWAKTVKTNAHAFQESKRLKEEKATLEASIAKRNNEVKDLKAELSNLSNKKLDLETDTNELSQLYTEMIRLREDASRIEIKKNQVENKEQQLNLMAPGLQNKSLEEYEEKMNKNLEEKDDLTKKISSLNKEMSSLNSRISFASTQLSKAEQNAREKKARYAEEEKLNAKKQTLNERSSELSREDQELSMTIIPLRQSVTKYETNRQRLRSDNKRQEEKLAEKQTEFSNDMVQLNSLSSRVEAFQNSNKTQELKEVVVQISEINTDIGEKESELTTVHEEINSLEDQMKEKERFQKTLDSNLRLLDVQEQIREMKAEYRKLQEEVNNLELTDEKHEEFEQAIQTKEKLLAKISKSEGRIESFKDQQEELKVSINSALFGKNYCAA